MNRNKTVDEFNSGLIKAKILSFKNGMEEFDQIKSIKIISSKYNLLIMEDYLPVIGEIIGDVYILNDSSVKEFKKIKGFYRHSHNIFELLINEMEEDNA